MTGRVQVIREQHGCYEFRIQDEFGDWYLVCEGTEHADVAARGIAHLKSMLREAEEIWVRA